MIPDKYIIITSIVGSVAFLFMPKPQINYVKCKKSKALPIIAEGLEYNENSIDSLIIELDKLK